MFLFGLLGEKGGFDPLVLLLAALILDVVVGDLRLIIGLTGHPLDPFGGLAGWFDRKLNRESRSQGDRAARGAVVVLILVALGIGAGLGVSWLSQTIPYAWILELVLLIILIPQRSLFTRVKGVGSHLRDGALGRARRAISLLSGRNAADADGHAVARMTVELTASRFTVAIVAPVFWYMMFGFPGFLVYQVVNALDRQIGVRSDRYRAFGFTAFRLNYVLTLIPGWLGGIFLSVAALFVPTANPAKAVRVMLSRDAWRAGANNGWACGAMAGALGLALTGRRLNEPEGLHWIGKKGRAMVTPQDIRRALFLYAVACLLNGVWVASLTVFRFA